MKRITKKDIIIKYLFISSLFIYYSFLPEVCAQTNWLNFSNSKAVRDIIFQNDYAWIATSGGLLKMDLRTEDMYLYNRANSGIPSNNISRLCIDSSNNIWVGTYDAGLAIFDGTIWKSYEKDFSTLNSNRILSLLADSKGLVWIGTDFGLYRFYDGYLRSDWDIQGIINDIVEDNNGAIWIATTGELLRIYDCKMKFWGQASKPIPFFNVSDLAVGKENKIWIVEREGIIVYDDSLFSKFDFSSVDFAYGLVSSLTTDSENNLWLASPYGEIAVYNGVNFQFFNDKNSELSGARINKIKVDNSGTLWVCTENGLYRYNYGWEFINTKTSILNTTQHPRIFADNNKNIWLTDGLDLYFFGKDKTEHYGRANSKFRGAYSIVNDKKGKIWIGHGDGLTLFDGRNWKEIDTLESIFYKRDKEIFEEYKDTNWVEKNYKHYLIDTNSIFDATTFVTNLTFDQRGYLWFRAGERLIKYDGTNWTVYDTVNSDIGATNISDIAIDGSNNIWIGTYTKGLIKYNGNEWIVYDSTNALIDNRINSVNIFNDSVFIATRKGTMLFDNEKWIEIFTGGNMHEIIKDENGAYWITVELGLVKTSEKDHALYSTINSGLANNYIQSICIDYNGNFWILTNGGINIFNEDGIVEAERIQKFFQNFNE
jgi:ligand-binding sensor domain-containing protein